MIAPHGLVDTHISTFGQEMHTPPRVSTSPFTPHKSSRARRHKIFPLKSRSCISRSPEVQSRVNMMQAKISSLTTSLFCKEKRERELQLSISQAIASRSVEISSLESRILGMYDTLRAKDNEIQILHLEIRRAQRCSTLVKENSLLQQTVSGSGLTTFLKGTHSSNQSTSNSFHEGTGIIHNYRQTDYKRRSHLNNPKDAMFLFEPVPPKEILSPFNLCQNQ